MVRTPSVRSECPGSIELVASLQHGVTVADIGCYGWLLGEAAEKAGAQLTGVDRAEPPGRPKRAAFARIDGSVIALPDDSCDLVIAGHVLEHVSDGVALASELVRIVKPGGQLWIETPSELSCMSASSDDPEDHQFLSFWDDPTHVRPWTPGALYRLAITCQVLPVAIQRTKTGDVHSVGMLALKPKQLRGRLPTRYVTLKDVPYGLMAAHNAILGAV